MTVLFLWHVFSNVERFYYSTLLLCTCFVLLLLAFGTALMTALFLWHAFSNVVICTCTRLKETYIYTAKETYIYTAKETYIYTVKRTCIYTRMLCSPQWLYTGNGGMELTFANL